MKYLSKVLFASIIFTFMLAMFVNAQSDSILTASDSNANHLNHPKDSIASHSDSIRMKDDSSSVAFIWDCTTVNPYKIDVLKRTDSVLVYLNTGSCSYHAPLDTYEINSNFGHRKYRFHYGVDLELKTGDPVSCAFDGIVRFARYNGAYGNCVVVSHNNGFETLYAHLSAITVGVGDTLESGEMIGLGGSTGRATGSHLHFETRFLGQPMDPNTIIDFKAGKLRFDSMYVSKSSFAYLVELRKTKYYTVRSGDNLWKISRKYGVSINTLCTLNHISRNSIIQIGQRLRYQ